MNWQEVFNQGERIVALQQPNWEFTLDGMLFFRHLVAYQNVLTCCKGKTILDLGCGSGYGSNLLSNIASKVTAIDVDSKAINWAKTHYTANNLEFRCGSIHESLNPKEKFDVIVSFQVIEHVHPTELNSFMRKIGGVLNSNGSVYFTTPNRLRRLHLWEKPQNPYHFTEYSVWSIKWMLRKHFHHVVVKGITGDSKVMKAEWLRGSTVTPQEYFILGPTKEIYTRAWYMWRQLPETIRKPAKQLLTPKWQNRSTRKSSEHHCSNGIPWQSDEAFSLNDFVVVNIPDWWCLDLFAEVHAPKKFDIV